MEIFIGNLPLDTSAIDLRKLLGNSGIKPRYRIFRKTLRDGTVKCYGQAAIEPDQVALELIERLNNTELRGHILNVRIYRERQHTNDRRARLWHGVPWNGLDRRKQDRRNTGR